MLSNYTNKTKKYLFSPCGGKECFKKRGNTGHNAYSKRNSNVMERENHAFITYKSIQLKYVNRYIYLLFSYMYFNC